MAKAPFVFSVEINCLVPNEDWADNWLLQKNAERKAVSRIFRILFIFNVIKD
jgi:hypothetical protein